MSVAVSNAIDARLLKRLPAVKDSPEFQLDLHLQTGDGICLVLGPSGSGKTLLLNCLGGFTRPDEGRIAVNDMLHFDAAAGVFLPPERRRGGYIFQDHALFPHMTVKENLKFAVPQSGARTTRRHRHRQIGELLETFGLENLGGRKPAQLSGGQKQRAALARILASEPQFLLLDEPARGLDAALREDFYGLLRSLRERWRIPTVLVSHDAAEGFEVADAVCLIESGRLIQAGPIAEVLACPASTAAANLLGAHVVLPAVIRSLDPGENKSRLLVSGQELEGPYFKGHLNGDTGFLCVRKSGVRVTTPSSSATHRQLTFQPQRTHLFPGGVRVFIDDGASLLLTTSEYALADEGRITFEFSPTAMTFLER